jgi:hypothetical protein
MVTPDLMSEEDIAKLIIPDDLPNEQPTLTAYIEAKVYDKEGHVIQYRRQPMRSPTQYLLALMAIPIIQTFQGPSTYQAVSFLVNVLSLPSKQNTFSPSTYCCNGANILWDFSIVLGSGTQPFSLTLNSLAAPIANGSGAGQLTYGSVSVTYSGTTIYTYVTVINYSSTTINITEIGLNATIYIQFQNTSNAYQNTTYTYLLTYDTFSPAITMPPGAIAAFKVALSFSG